MKKIYTVVYCLLACCAHVAAQGIYQFWATTDNGGPNNGGVLFSTKYDGTGLRVRKSFEVTNPGYTPGRSGLVAYNSKLYGMMPYGGINGHGIIVEYNPASGAYVTRADLSSIGADFFSGTLVVFADKLYGVTDAGGQFGYGVIFEYDPATNGLEAKHHFNIGSGIMPSTPLVVHNSRLYGVTHSDGFDQGGWIFSYQPLTNVYTNLAPLTHDIGQSMEGALMPHNGKLYGAAANGGTDGYGTIFEFDPATNNLVKKADMAAIGAASPGYGMVKYNNKFYGGTRYGGVNAMGVIYEFNPLTGALVKKLDLTQANGQSVEAGLTLYNNKMYGVASKGGNSGTGVLFEYDPVANTYTKKINFSGQLGENPMGTLYLVGDKLYGLANYGGAAGWGTLYEYTPSFNGILAKVHLGISNGHSPRGKTTYYNGKLYGITSSGGNHSNGVIYSYDLATGAYAIRYHMNKLTGYSNTYSSMTLYNNKFYGVAYDTDGDNGVLYEFDPLTDNYTIRHQFAMATGSMPSGTPVVYNNKLYGTTLDGGGNDEGVLYEYDLGTSTYAAKVLFGGNLGRLAYAGLTVHNNRIYGTCGFGGANDKGTIFEYIPVGNGIIKRHDFTGTEGSLPQSNIVVLNNKLYGTTSSGGEPVSYGILYEYDLATSTFTKKHDFKKPAGYMPNGSLTAYNNKLFGLNNGGGSDDWGGTLFVYDLATNTCQETVEFDGLNGHAPERSQLIPVPALVAPGTPGTCVPVATTGINASNASQWVPFTDEEGNAVLEINANGNILGNVTVNLYTHDGATRKDANGRLYLDRNLSITVENQPASPVSVRFYIRKKEFESLKNTPDAGVVNITDLTIFKNEDACADGVGKKALPITTSVTSWGLDYVYTAQLSSFSSFFFSSKAFAALPVKLEYFKGEKEATANRLRWKASCTEHTDFIVERSSDGVTFQQIGVVLATVDDCGTPFEFSDQNPLVGKQYYRLQMKESSGAITYSPIVMLDRGGNSRLAIQVMPNPVQGAQAVFSIHATGSKKLAITLYDAMGKLLLRTQWQLQPGSQLKYLDVQKLPPGVYSAVWEEDTTRGTIRLVRL